VRGITKEAKDEIDRLAMRVWSRHVDPEYYGIHPYTAGSTWGACVDVLNGTGHPTVGRIHSCRGAE
jgi:hypothetical protein